MRAFAIPFFLIPLIIDHSLIPPVSQLSLKFWLPTLIVSMIMTPLETIFYYESIKDEEISLALPILSLSPIITVLIGIITIGEIPKFLGILGIFFILFGVYALKIGHTRHGLLEPLRHLHSNRSVRLMAVVMLSASIGGLLDKIAVQASNPFFYAAVNFILLSAKLFTITLIKAKNHLRDLKNHFRKFFILGGVVAGYSIFYLLALNTGITSYVIAIKNASILFTIVLGITLFKEKDRKAKILAGASIFIGLILIKVFG